jgi:L-lactate dehydrogenase complex protein LldE
MTRVAIFATCLGDQFFAEACADAVRLLRRLGCDVEVPPQQTCCGQPAYNAGRRAEAERMARHTLAALRDAEHVVLPSGSCAGMIRCFYPSLLGGGGRDAHGRQERVAARASGADSQAAAAEALAARTYELSQFVVEVLGVRTLGSGLRDIRVAYHHSCHALRELGVRDAPLVLLRGCGAEVVPWIADEECCGFGGLFSTKLPEVSAGMADRKLGTLPAVEVVTSSDGGCLMQLRGRANRVARDGATARAAAPRFEHLASLLWKGVRG